MNKKYKTDKTQSLESKANQRAHNSIMKQYGKEKILQFLNIGDNSLQQKTNVKIDEPLFQAEPKVILFTDYEPLQHRSQVLKLRNRDVLPRRVSIVPPESRLFQVTPYKKYKKDGYNNKHNEEEYESLDMSNTKVASGMEVSYLIKFTPEAKVDVRYDLRVITEREQFIVPIIGIGCQVMLEFNEHLDFGEVPVKYKIEKPIILRNVGEKITKWKLKTNSNTVSVSKKEGILEVGKSEQIICTFCPEEDREYVENMTLNYDELEAIIKVTGRSKNDNVKLSKSVVQLDNAYISKHSQSFITIENNTSVPIEFSWKGNSSKQEEDSAKAIIFQKLARQEDEEKILNELQYEYEEAQGDRSFDIDDSYDEEEMIKINERHHIKNITIIARRFEKIKKCLAEDEMLYEHDNFVIEPIKGKIWPNTGMNICITFKPQEATQYDQTAYCDVTGSQSRLPLKMIGLGIGPKARLSTEEINLFDREITSEYKVENFTISNVGVIDCEFTILPNNSPCGKQFFFNPNKYILKPPGEDSKNNGTKNIEVLFKASRLGEFSEKFDIQIEKSGNKKLSVVFKGHVIAPSCRFELPKPNTGNGINFGPVSLREKKFQTVYLHNESSSVSIEYSLRISSDNEDSKIDTIFQLDPKNGVVGPNDNKKITIYFFPEVEKVYEIVVLLDMKGIGFDMLTLPVSGECKIPEIVIEPSDVLNFGTISIGKAETKQIVLRNPDSTLNSQFEIEKPDDSNNNVSISVSPSNTSIPPNSSVIVYVTLTANKLKNFAAKLLIYCKTKANANSKDERKHTYVRIIGVSEGPQVTVRNNKLSFNNIAVLDEVTKEIELVNVSDIPAEFTAFMKKENSMFKIKQNRRGFIDACTKDIYEKTTKIKVSIRPTFRTPEYDTMYIKVKHCEDIAVDLECFATGHCVTYDEKVMIPIKDENDKEPKKLNEKKANNFYIDFKTNFTGIEVNQIVKFTNKGSRVQYLKWIKKEQKKVNKDKEDESDIKNNSDEDVFTVEKPPSNININQPKNGILFTLDQRTIREITIKAKSNIDKEFHTVYDLYVIDNPNDNNSNNDKSLYATVTLKAVFIKPFLILDPPSLYFEHKYEKGNELTNEVKKQVKGLTLKNKTKLPAHFIIKNKAPFTINSGNEYNIPSDEQETVLIEFDPTPYSIDKLTIDKKKSTLEIIPIINGLPYKEQLIEIYVSCIFPNLDYSLKDKVLDFKSILNDTYKVKTFTIKNKNDDMDLEYEFILLEDENTIQEDKNINAIGLKKSQQKITKKLLLSEVFSIVPMNGILKPSSTEIVRVTFTPGSDCEYSAALRCEIIGGPDEKILLKGVSSSIIYKILFKKIDEKTEPRIELSNINKKDHINEIFLGKIPFNKETRISFTIKNEGKVDFNVNIDYKSEKLRYIKLYKHSFIVKAQTNEDIDIDFMPGTPEFVYDIIQINIAHFEPIIVKIHALGFFSTLIIDLPRYASNNMRFIKPINTYKLEDNLLDINKMFSDVENSFKALKHDLNRKEVKSNYYTKIYNDKKTNAPKPIVQHEKEIEVNRHLLINKLQDAINTAETEIMNSYINNNTSNLINMDNDNKLEVRVKKVEEEMKKIEIAKYVHNFVDIEAGKSKSQIFKIHNYNDYDININLELYKTVANQNVNTSIFINNNYYNVNSQNTILIVKHSFIDVKVVVTDNEKKEQAGKVILKFRIKEVKDAALNSSLFNKESGEVYRVDFNYNIIQPNIKIKLYSGPEITSKTTDLPVVINSPDNISFTNNLDISNVSAKLNKKPSKSINQPITSKKLPAIKNNTNNNKTNNKSNKHNLKVENDKKVFADKSIEIKENPTVLRNSTVSASINEINYGNVIIGRKKIIKILLSNEKNVTSIWNITSEKPSDNAIGMYNDKDEVFTCYPTQGSLSKNMKQILTISFMPSDKKPYGMNLKINIVDSASHIICLKGQGIDLSVNIIPDRITMQPILPYYKYCIEQFYLENNNDVDIEVVSLDYDKQYLEEEKLINSYKVFKKGGSTAVINPLYNNNTLNYLINYNASNNFIDLPIRNPGDDIWEIFTNYNNKLQAKKEELLSKVENEKDNISELILKKLNDGKYVELDDVDDSEFFYNLYNNYKEDALKVPQHKKLNIILIGPKRFGKTSLCNEQLKDHKRSIINIENIIKWNKDNNYNDTINKVELFLEERKKDLEKDKLEREKLLKQAKTNKKIKVEDLPQIEDKDYLILSKEIWLELLTNRCNNKNNKHGVIFDDLIPEESDFNYIENNEVLLEYIEEVLKDQNIKLVCLKFPIDKEGLMCCNYINFYKIANSKNDLKNKIKNEFDNIKDKNKNSKFNNKNVNNNNNKNVNININNNKSDINYRNKSNYNSNSNFGFNSNKNRGKENQTNSPKDSKYKPNTYWGNNNGVNNVLSNLNKLTTTDLSNLNSKKLHFSSPNDSIDNEKIREYYDKIELLKNKFTILKSTRDKIIEEEINNYDERIKEVTNNYNNNKVENSDIKSNNSSKHNKDNSEIKNINDNTNNSKLTNNNNTDVNNLDNVIKSKTSEELKEDLSVTIKNLENSKPFKVERDSQDIDIEYYLPNLYENYRKSISKPYFPKEEDIQLPPPLELQTLKKIERHARVDIKNFELKGLNPLYVEEYNNNILVNNDNYTNEIKDSLNFNKENNLLNINCDDINTIKNLLMEEDKTYEEKLKEYYDIQKDPKKRKQIEEERKKNKGKNNKSTNEYANDTNDLDLPPKKKQVLINKTRWIIPKNSKIPVYVTFYSSNIYNKEDYQKFDFEVLTYPPKRISSLFVTAYAGYPSNLKVVEDISGSMSSHINNLRNMKMRNLTGNNSLISFGYILSLNEVPSEDLHNYFKTHCKVINFSNNNSKFDMEIKFVFLSQLNQEFLGFTMPLGNNNSSNEQESVSGQNFNKDKKPNNNMNSSTLKLNNYNNNTPFILSVKSLYIKKGEKKELQIYCIPNKNTEYKDQLICLIKDNPKPITIDLSCVGCEPKLDVDNDLIEFEKTIINQGLSKTLILKNSGEVPCKWSISNTEVIPKQFKFSIISGQLEKGKSNSILIEFKSDIQEKYNFVINIDCEDIENYLVKIPTKSIKISAEAFKVNVEPIINSENKVLDFGNLKVNDYKTIPFSLKNHGIYKVKYKFEINSHKKTWIDLFKFEPSEGEIEPLKDKNILAICMPYSKEISISDKSTEIKLHIFDGEKSSRKCDPISIFVKVSSNFSRYRINPLKTINFGSMQYDESSTRSIEIFNEGQFEFNYDIRENEDEETMKTLKEQKILNELEEIKLKEKLIKEEVEIYTNNANNASNNKLDQLKKQKDKNNNNNAINKKDEKKTNNKNNKPEENFLKVGKYLIYNYQGSIPPGSSAKVDVEFLADGNENYSKTLSIDISGRNPEDNPNGIFFDILGQSCIPSIETKDFDSIFEEQTVLQSFNIDNGRNNIINSNIYSIEDKVFWFGTVIASKNPDGVTEKFKIINPNKIACSVKFKITQIFITKHEGFAFELSDKGPIKIYPNEHAYISVTFKPTNVMPYSGTFEAIVDKGDLESGVLKFDLRGEGTLPTLQLDNPSYFQEDGMAVLKFNKTRINKQTIAYIQLKNDGVVPSTVKFEPLVSNSYEFLSSTTATIQPKSYMRFDIKFNPFQAGIEKHVLNFKTLYNQFENSKLLLLGEGYYEPVYVEGLNNENELNFGDLCIGYNKTLDFELQNHSEYIYRFNFLNLLEPFIEVTPSIGYILPKQTKTIYVKFKVDENSVKDRDLIKDPIKYVNKEMYFETKQIKINSDKVEELDWDNSYKYVKKVTQTEYNAFKKKQQEDLLKRKEEVENLYNIIAGVKKAPEKKKEDKKTNKKEDDKINNILNNNNNINNNLEEANIDIEIAFPEPDYAVIDKTEKYLNVKIFGTADYVRYQCEVKEIKFKPTMMYASRKHEFQLKNTSNIALNYNFSFTNYIYLNNKELYLSNSNNNQNLVASNTMNLLKQSATNSYFHNSNNFNNNKRYNPYNDPGPFTVVPRSGTIAPNSDESIVLRFSPLEVDDLYFKRTLICHMKDLDPNYKDLNIEICGDSERPVCYFELDGGIKQENGYKILEFDSVGMMVINTKKFYVLNPTNMGYEFEWEQLEEENPNNKMFKCLTTKGLIFSGKKYEMIFEYLPDSLGNHQTYWNFKINSENISHKFLFSGMTKDPLIMFDIGKINFGPLLVKGKITQNIKVINQEQLPYKFNFEKESIKNISNGNSLMVAPMSGILAPNSSTNVAVTFFPQLEKEYNYNLCLKVRNRSKPLYLNVKGEGYNINHNVYLDNKPELRLLHNHTHEINFGNFFIKEKRERYIILENTGTFNFHFVVKKNNADYLKISPDSGTINKHDKIKINLTILALSKLNLTNHKINLQIVTGDTYTFIINAKASSPQIKFSSTKVDFGQIYVQRPPQSIKQIITVSNLDQEALTVETNFENITKKSHIDVLLSTGQVILPSNNINDALKIPIIFTPREVKKYRDTISIKFNGIYEQEVEITGEGIPLKVDIEENIQSLNFGIIQLREKKNMDFSIINRGRMRVEVQIFPENLVNFEKKNLEFKNIDHRKTYILEPKHSRKVEILFNPQSRIPLFREDLKLKINNNDLRKLITVTGASYGVEVSISGDMTPFGTVVANSMTERIITLKNSGDLLAKFNWVKHEGRSNNDNFINNNKLETNYYGKHENIYKYDKRDYSKFFTFEPESGSIPPLEEKKVKIIFHPKVVESNIAFEKIKCNIENSEPLFINLYGRSCEVPEDSIKEYVIETQVRVKKTLEIKLKNDTNIAWNFTPTISTRDFNHNAYFIGERAVDIKPNSEGSYIVTYLPLTMTINKLPHEATVFFPIPDGSAKLFKIIGNSLEPKATTTINETSKAREWKTIKLNIKNWLYKNQRFKVTWKVDKEYPCIFIKGANTIDIGANTSKEYKLSYRSWKEINCQIIVNFENVETKEYVFYQINMETSPGDAFEATSLVGQVRDLITENITITNPLKEEVSINQNQIHCDNEYIDIKNKNFTIKAESEAVIEISYRPLIKSQKDSYSTSIITIKSPELGELKYPLILKGSQLPPIKQLPTIVTTLGSEKVVNYTINHYLKKATQYHVTVEKINSSMPNPIDFSPQPDCLNVSAFDSNKPNEVNSKVKYEPYFIGESRAYLRVHSNEGGEFMFLLIGICNSPQAQGPIKIPINKVFGYEFKNPLNETADINVRFDNNSFSCNKLNPKIDAKKSTTIQITYKPTNDNLTTGRMIVTLNKLPPWIIYLQAE